MNKKIIGVSSLLALGLVAGGVASISSASAAETPALESSAPATYPLVTPTEPTVSETSETPRAPETPVATDLASELSAIALAKYPGATVDRVENDNDGATYEAHLTLADGSHVTVKFDADKNITATEVGRHKGNHAEGTRTPEEAVTGDLATELGNLALAQNAGATVDRVEKDNDGATYEAHLTLADGSHVTVKFDADKNITATEVGGHRGGHKGPRH